ncbi:hypothetical protein ZOSMA_81G01140 [Zostera marina]|uniref:Myb-like domain-containing protein n=1 Tax=Zostera marina TaxID=29655 RepID=A0A0K9NM77_ZOSMR|nr:hypothetical protein ZOSMA_81G01140 [Zostera marina]
MEFFDEARPSIQFHSRSSATAASVEPKTLIKTTKLAAILCFLASSLLMFFAFYYLASFQFLNSLFVWLSVSLLVGPFAPVSLTGGDVHVGRGEILEEEIVDHSDLNEMDQVEDRDNKKFRRSKRSDYQPAPASAPAPSLVSTDLKKPELNKTKPDGGGTSPMVLEEEQWTEADYQILKKQIGKRPVGTPRRWEIIAEVFEGRHGVESVVKAGKSLSERKQGMIGDSFAQFLKQRKPVDKRVVEEGIEHSNDNLDITTGSFLWSSGEDIALLNALKSFPKDTPMRWEKIEAAVPGKSKTLCLKRVAELKKDFRSTKTS